ncbi:MAG TPA: hypothetical protein VLV32_04400 [Burkholderiales bacterium]|nr:hypothetical protein [Burkholderiales bacterium]
MKMLIRMFILGAVATANIAASHAHAQMNPGIAKLKAVSASLCVRDHVLGNLRGVFAIGGHLI